MKKIALGINEAAKATGTSPRIIAEAIAAQRLDAHELEGKPVIARCELKAWIKSLPKWYPAT